MGVLGLVVSKVRPVLFCAVLALNKGGCPVFVFSQVNLLHLVTFGCRVAW